MSKSKHIISDAIISQEDIQNKKIDELQRYDIAQDSEIRELKLKVDVLESKVRELEFKAHTNRVLIIIGGISLTVLYAIYFIMRHC